MLMTDIKTIARELGVKPGNMNKGDLIRSIQTAEGNCACFGPLEGRPCDQTECLWREDCRPACP
jgi:hypothetical protein